MKTPSRLKSNRTLVHRTFREKKSDARSVRAELARAQEALRQRTAELAIINSVQLGLATQVHVQDIYDLIGDKIRDIFNAQVVMISSYDPQTDTVMHRYAIERGKRVYVPEPQPSGGFRRQIIESGEPLLVNTDVVAKANAVGQPTLPGTEPVRSWLGVPMRVGNRVTGVMSLQNLDKENAFNESDVRLLQTLASSMSVAIENARLFEQTLSLVKETEQRAAELATVNHVSRALASQVELDALIQLAGQQIRDTFNADIAYIALLDSTRQWIEFPYTYGETLAAIQYGEGLTSKIIETRQPLLINRDMEIRRVQIGATLVGIDVKSYLGVPIMVGTQAIGVVSVQNIQQEGLFNENDQHLLMTIAANVGIAIERTRHFDAEQRRAEQFRVISEVGHRITALLPVETLLSQMATLIQGAFNYFQVGFGLIEGDVVVSKAEVGPLSSAYIAKQFKIGIEGLWGWVAHTGEPLLIADTASETHLYAIRRADQVHSQLCVPLKTKEGVIGVLGAESNHPNGLDESDMMVLQSLANQAAVAIENARRFITEKRRAEQFQIIAEIGRSATSLLDTNQIIQQVTRLLQQAFNYYHVGIGLIEYDEVVYRVGAGTLWDDSNFTFKPQRLRIGKQGLTGWVAAHGTPVLVPDVSQDSRYVLMLGSATRSELIVPIIIKEQVIGVLDVQSDQLDAFDNTDLAVVQSIANQTSIAIENARLYERAQELAVMQERTRLARDLHDAVTQTLFSASLIADALPSSWEKDPDEGRQLLQELRQLSRGALAEMRTLLLELRPTALVETRLGDLLKQLSEAAAGRIGINVDVHIDGDCKLEPEVHIAMYRIAQEALNNVLKHSRATQVFIDLDCAQPPDGRTVTLTIKDNGRGFDRHNAPPNHFGLGNMRESAQSIGAELNIFSQPGQGTEIKVIWNNPGETSGEENA